MAQFVYNGHCSRDFGALVTGRRIYNIPERDAEEIAIPGRNGSVVMDRGRWHNTPVDYLVGIPSGFPDRWTELAAAIAAEPGYHRLEDDFDPFVFRLARLAGEIEPEIIGPRIAGEAEITFSAKPQKFLKIGENPVEFSASGGHLRNAWMEAMPLITVRGSGSGTLTVGEVTVEISAIDGYVVLDCDTCDAYKGTSNKNSTITTDDFPTLPNGISTISWTGGVTSVEIIPRWWRL